MIFISYRRGVASPYAGRLSDAITRRFGEGAVFFDTNLEPAVDFVKSITAALESCRVMLAVIGPRWATIKGRHGQPRLWDARDFVRVEVEAALQDPTVTVIPLLVRGARMPDPRDLPEELRALPDLNGMKLSDDRWRDDERRLIATLDGLIPTASGVHKEVPLPTGASESSIAPPPKTAALPREAGLTHVTAMYCDVEALGAGRDEPDGESLAPVMDRWYRHLSRAVEHHGGTMERYGDDAVMAFFGIPELHEDDALRAVRAADEARKALAQLNDELRAERGITLEARTGVSSGDVMTGNRSPGGSIAVGEPVKIARRLGQAASAGDVLLARTTHLMLGDAVKVDAAEPLSLGGQKEPLATFRLTEVAPPAPGAARRLDSRMVGRSGELARLREAFEEAVREHRCQLATVLGPAGIGKSRLTQELVGDFRDRARVLEGRCLPYGEGITFWPVAGIVKEATGIEETDSAREVRSKIAGLLPRDEDAGAIVEHIAGTLGFSDAPAEPEETFWAVRKFLEALADDGPLVVVFDDIHWGGPTFLSLIEYLAGYGRQAAILLICLARLQLRDQRPSLPGIGTSVELEPLDHAQSEKLIENLLGDASLPQEATRQIQTAAEGNPLFLEEMLQMLVDDGRLWREDGSWRAAGDLSIDEPPKSIHVLLDARLDLLNPAERELLKRGAVIGQEFSRGSVAALFGENERGDLGFRLDTLVRKELLRPLGKGVGGDESFRFAHILIRDVAYRRLLRKDRAELHERFADWLEKGPDRGRLDEIVGYHLEQAYLFRARGVVGQEDDATQQLGRRAAERLVVAGQRAFALYDLPATVNLYERATGLPPESDPARLALLPDLAYALRETGALRKAHEVVEKAIDAAQETNARLLEKHATIELAFLQLYTDPDVSIEAVIRRARDAIRVFEDAGDLGLLARALRLLGDAHSTACRHTESAKAFERGLRYAQRAGDRREEAQLRTWIAFSHYWGPTPVTKAIRHNEETLERAKGEHVVTASILLHLAGLTAMEGRFREARDLYARARAIAEEFGLEHFRASMCLDLGRIELLAGDPDAAERDLRSGCEALDDLGDKAVLSTAAAFLAEALYEQGTSEKSEHFEEPERFEESELFTRVSEEAAANHDLLSQVGWRATRAKLLAQADRLEEARSLALEAVERARTTDDLNLQGRAVMDLARVLELSGESAEARQIITTAEELYVAKGNRVAANHARRRLGASMPG